MTLNIEFGRKYEASKEIFSGQAKLAQNEADDRKLQFTAQSVISYYESMANIGIYCERAADAAIRLLHILPPPQEYKTSLVFTRSYLWRVIITGYERTHDRRKEKFYAEALLRMPSFDQPHERDLFKVFEGDVRECFARCDLNRLVRLGTRAFESSNETVVRKVWQTIGAKANKENLVRAMRLLHEEETTRAKC